MGDFPPTLSAEQALENDPDATAIAYRTVNTKFGIKPVLTLADGKTEVWGTPFMSRQLGITPDPPSVKRPTARVHLPARIESYSTDLGTGYKLVPESQ